MTHCTVIIYLDAGGVVGDFEIIEHVSEAERNAFVNGASMMLDDIAYYNPPDKLIGWRMVCSLDNLEVFVSKEFAEKIRREALNHD